MSTNLRLGDIRINALLKIVLAMTMAFGASRMLRNNMGKAVIRATSTLQTGKP